jgi:pyruvate/2-oxoglutarate/acetoin dehydrogenase E1 component/TPP-dependent pyruvate/acetoin dehydrogenase alpha subunit
MTEASLAQAELKYKAVILEDYRIAYLSRLTSLLGRKEVLTGKAKFGIFGDGKELPQLAMAKAFKNGDFRSGYYRDQTFMMASGLLSIQEFFAQLYAHTDVTAEPASAGRMMNGHYGTRTIDEQGQWKDLKNLKNSSSDISPTAGQMLRLVGLAHASKYYRENQAIIGENQFSVNGNEVAWGTIGNASSSEGHFFEAINAGGVLQIPMVVSVWDDSYGISVHAKYQTTKENISEILKGFQRDEKGEGYQIFTVKGWDYPALCAAYEEAGKLARERHIPCLIHVTELTQPQGHSTSGSHERYKSKERLNWEIENDCNKRFKEWIVSNKIATEHELEALENEAKIQVNVSKKNAWEAYLNPIKIELNNCVDLISNLAQTSNFSSGLNQIKDQLLTIAEPIRKDIGIAIHAALRLTRKENLEEKNQLALWRKEFEQLNAERYNSSLFSDSAQSVFKVKEIKPEYSDESKIVDGREVLVAYFDQLLTKDPRVLAFGEDVGKIGDVNQGFAGLQEKHGESRVFDTGIRELTIIGQGIGTALRGLRPIAEIQYLDYLLYAIQPLSDDLATLQYRTKGGQKAPLILRTRGHRLEGIWHSGSPMGMILGAIRGMHLLTPRNMVQAAGMYQTLMQSDEPAIIIECLNGYRLKEKMPDNIGTYTVPLGIPEIIEEGADVTVVSYGSTLRLVQEASKLLKELGINIELIDPQTLLPFDINHTIGESLKKTNKLIVVDEDVPGGASAYILQQILEQQNGYFQLDAAPITITAKAHRPAYGTDGDYFSKPNVEEIYDQIFQLILDNDPARFQ